MLKETSFSKIHYAKPSITDREVRYATDAAANGWGEHCYDYIARFENAFREYMGMRFALATSSCTGALHIGLSALGIGPGDEVIIADINWIASVAPVLYVGATPVFIDISPDSWCIDPKGIEKALTPRTRAIIAVHLYGNLCEMDEILDIGCRRGIPVIEDAAEALGSLYKGHRAGSMGVFSTFSFHGTKTVTTGEGGMLVTNDSGLFDKALTLANHGRDRNNPKQFWPDMIGYKYKLSNIQAAIGCAQMERVEELVSRKREIFSGYRTRFSLLKGVAMNPEPDGTLNSYWMPTVVFDRSTKFDRVAVLESFRAHNIDGRVFFYPLSSLPMFTARPENTISYDIHERALNLPSYHDITPDDMDRVVRCVTETLG